MEIFSAQWQVTLKQTVRSGPNLYVPKTLSLYSVTCKNDEDPIKH